jgi:glycosyltransferase 2 family protein
VGGDAVTIALGLRETKNGGAILLGSVVNRVLDLASLIAISLAGAGALGDALDLQARRLLETILIVAAGASVLLLFVFVYQPKRLPWRAKQLYLKNQKLIDALRNPRTYIAPFALSIFVQLSLLVLTVWLAMTSGLHIGLSAWLLAWPLAKLVALLPLTMGGIGAREVALAVLLRPFGVPPASAIAVALAWDGVLIGGSLFAGLISRVLAVNSLPAPIE